MGHASINPYPIIAQRGRVILSGYGADPVLASLRLGHIRKRIREKRFWQLAKDLTAYFSADGRFSRLYLGRHWQRLVHPNRPAEEYPEWLNPELEKRLNLRDRWEQAGTAYRQTNNSVRPEAYRALAGPGWVAAFASADPGATHHQVECRHPFFDSRLVKFLLALPALPWCADKEILREAMRGVLPDEVRLRRKSPLHTDPIHAALQRPETKWVDAFEATPGLEKYVVRSRMPKLLGVQDALNSWVNLRPISLSFWLQRFKKLGYHQSSNSSGGSA
jgi:asparagine synthase (glutamine-hydrolysing)